MLNYKEKLKDKMELLATNNKVIFLGYNVGNGSKATGTLKNIKQEQLFEMPVAENLMLSTAIGLALGGFKPVVYFERFDFILNAMDSLFNHLDKIQKISNNQYNPVVIIRVVVGNKNKPLYTGITHTQDYSKMLSDSLTNVLIRTLNTVEDVDKYYNESINTQKSMILVEYKDLY